MINYCIAAFIAIASSTVASADEVKHLAKHFRGSIAHDNISSGRRQLSPIKIDIDTICNEEIHRGRCIDVCTEITSTWGQFGEKSRVYQRECRGDSRKKHSTSSSTSKSGKAFNNGKTSKGKSAKSNSSYDRSDGSGSSSYDGLKCDIHELRNELVDLLHGDEPIEHPRENAPDMIRLAFHDCVGHHCDGCVDLENSDNAGLREIMELLLPIVQKYKHCLSRGDIWAYAALIAADMAVVGHRPKGLHFPFTHVGREDCQDSDEMGNGGGNVEMPSNHLTHHELVHWFHKHFNFDAKETVAIMGGHSMSVASPTNLGFGNRDENGEDIEDGWNFSADEYILDHRYYAMYVGPEAEWEQELVYNDEPDIPHRYQWFHEREGEVERPISTNADMALVYNLDAYMYTDDEGNEGAVDCEVKTPKRYSNSKRILADNKKKACPIADNTIDYVWEYYENNDKFLLDFQRVFIKMLQKGYDIGHD